MKWSQNAHPRTFTPRRSNKTVLRVFLITSTRAPQRRFIDTPGDAVQRRQICVEHDLPDV